MKQLFNPTTITSSGYCTFSTSMTQGGSIITNGYIYSPLISFPLSKAGICTDEHGHYTRNTEIRTEIKFTLYDSEYTSQPRGAITYTSTNDLIYPYTDSNINGQGPATDSGYPFLAGNYYLQIDGQSLFNDFYTQGIATGGLSGFSDYPLHIEFVCEVCGCKCEPEIITTTIEPNSAIYNAGYYYIPFSKPNHDTNYASVRARAAVVPFCPHSIVEMRKYYSDIKVTASTDQQAQEILMDNAIVEFFTYDTLYLKLSYNEMHTLVDELISFAPGTVEQKINDEGWAIKVQILWYKADYECESIGHTNRHSTFKLQGSTHDISLYRGTIPVHKHYKAIPDARFDGENNLYVTWNAVELRQTITQPEMLYIGLAIRNSVEYSRVLKMTGNQTERRARGRIRPRERVIWIQTADFDDEVAYIENLSNIVRSNLYLMKKLNYFFSNWHDSYTYVRPVLGYYRQDCEDCTGGPHWLCASDKSFLVHL